MVARRALAALLLASACSFPEQPLPPGTRAIVVHGVLDPSRTVQVVNVRLTDGVDHAPEDTYGDMTLTLPDGTVLTAARGSDQGPDGRSYRFDMGASGVSLAPGGTYRLRIAMLAGDTISGETTIPSAAPGTEIVVDSFSRTRDTLRMNWPRVHDARAYEVQVWHKESYTTDGSYGWYELPYHAFADTSLVLAGTAQAWDGSDVFPPFRTTYAYAYAVDDNYYEYYRTQGDPFMGAAPSRLKGALGLFGAVVPIRQYRLEVCFDSSLGPQGTSVPYCGSPP